MRSAAAQRTQTEVKRCQLKMESVYGRVEAGDVSSEDKENGYLVSYKCL